MGLKQPFFSIVIPVYNRPREITRAIGSCFNGQFENFEVVVVDDASTDDTALVVNGIRDPRVTVVRQLENRGQSPSRNAGVDVANGEWIVFLDSDDELTPGALHVIARTIAEADPSIDRFGFMYRWDDGRCSPSPAPTGEILNYRGHIEWLETSVLNDALCVTRRSTFRVCRMPDSRSAPSSYHLDFAAKFKSQWVPVIAALEHADAQSRLSDCHKKRDPKLLIERAHDDYENFERMFCHHGEALRQYAPRKYRIWRRAQISAAASFGDRGLALRLAWSAMIEMPRRFDSLLLPLIPLVGRDGISLARTARALWQA